MERFLRSKLARVLAVMVTALVAVMAGMSVMMSDASQAKADVTVNVNGTQLTFNDDLSHVTGTAYVVEGVSGNGAMGPASSTFHVAVAGQVVTGYCWQSWNYQYDHDMYPAPSNCYASFDGTRNSDGTYALTVHTEYANSYASWVIGHPAGYTCQTVYVPSIYIPLNGKGHVQKGVDTSVVSVAGNPYYKMDGIQFSLYQGGQLMDVLQLNSNGRSGDSRDLPAGQYTLRETRNENSGFITNGSEWTVSVVATENTEWGPNSPNIKNQPIYGYVRIVKKSRATNQPVLREGFEFDLFNSSNVKVAHAVTDNTGMAIFKKLDGSGLCPLPLGDYYAKETAAPEPYFPDTETTYPVQLRQFGNGGSIQNGHNNGSPEGRSNVVDVEAWNKQWGFLQVIKMNVATGNQIQGGQFRFALYKSGDHGTPIATATTSGGIAYFVDSSGSPAKLVTVNGQNATEGYYDIYETSVEEPFYPLGEKISVALMADGQTGATKAIISAPESTGTVFKSGQPIEGTYTETGQASQHSSQTNSIPVEVANDQYGYINVIKKNMELGKSGVTVNQAGFKFRLYYTEADALSDSNYVEEIETDGTGTKPFTTRLPVRRTARTDTGKPNVNASRCHIIGETGRNDGVYYVRESYAPAPYNKSNLIYRFTLDAADGAAGTEGQIKAQVDIRTDREGRNEAASGYDQVWRPYWTIPGGNNGIVSIHGDTRLSGANVANVADTTAENAPQYGRATILKKDAEDTCIQRGAEYQVYALEEVTYTSQRISGGVPTAGYDPIGGDLLPSGYSKNKSQDVNEMSWPLNHVGNRDVSTTTNVKPAQTSFDAATGAVTFTQGTPITFQREDGSTYDTIVTDEYGKATTGWLPIGSSGSARYALVEVKTSNGHVIDGTPIEFTLTYDSALQDAECIISSKETSNRRDDQMQEDKPNEIEVYKSVKPSASNPDGGPLEGVTIGFWKEEDDLTTTPMDSDGTYSFDAAVIRTSGGIDMKPSVHQRITGTELYIEELESDLRATLVLAGHRYDMASEDPTETGVVTGGSEGIIVTDNKRIDITKQHVADTVPTGIYDIILVDTTTGKVVPTGGQEQVFLGEGMRTHLRINRGVLTGAPTVSVADSYPIEIRNSNLHYDVDNDAWIATNLKFGAEYEVEFDRKVVNVIHTSETGGHVWYGRFSYDETPWFHNGWLNQAALPTSDSKIILRSNMTVNDGDPKNDKFSTNAITTKNNEMWLQDTVDARTYGDADIVDGNGNALKGYAMVTDKDGLIHNKRIGAGKYVMAEIKPPVDERLHQTYLPDTHPHYFEVDDVTGYITDTDDKVTQANRHDYNYDPDRHYENESHIPTTKKRFIFIDDVTKLRLSKREMADGEELVGAELILTASNNDVIDRWISTETPHYIEMLTPGWYRLTEYATPKNYDKAESIEFNLLPSGEVQHTIMFDTPIYIDAEIDKIQEIGNPLGEQDRPNGDGKNHAAAQENENGLYAYSLDFRSTSNTWTDEFTVEDPLEPADDGFAKLRSIVTPQTFQDYDGKMNVWYQTNKTPEDYRDLDSEVPHAITAGTPADEDEEEPKVTPIGQEPEEEEITTVTEQPVFTYKANATYDDHHENPWLADDKAMVADEDRDWRIIDFVGWKLWRKDVSTAVGTRLDVEELGLDEDEYVTGIRFEYGRVEVGFTSRTEDKEWVRENLKYEHDDADKITGLSSQSFQSTERAADAAISRMNILTSRFTTDMSFMLEDYILKHREQLEKDYKAKLITIDEYNQQISELDNAPLPKFAEALKEPAFVDDAEDVAKLDSAVEAAKASIDAAFPLANTYETRNFLLVASKQALADIEPVASKVTLDNLNEKIANYETEIARLPSEVGGYDIDKANTELRDAFMRVLDDIKLYGLSGRIPYAPAVLHMQLTEDYVPGVTMRNSARVDAYRNGGNGKDEEADETHNLEGHDEDEVVQTPRKKDDVFIGTKLATVDGQKIVTADGQEAVVLIDVVEYHNLEPGKRYQMDGILHVRGYDDKAKKPIDGGTIKGSGSYTAFTPEQPDGTVEVKLVMPASEILFRPVVAYEELREIDKKSGVASDIIVAEHKDITNEDQTIQVTLPAEDIVQTAPILQTGDKIALVAIGSLAATIGFGTVAYVAKRRKQ